jgi:hypothetical protein
MEYPELVAGILVVTAIAAMMTLLYIFAAGFNYMKLTDRGQALGLPEGSIRAMIALILIMVFIIFGIYLFRNVATGNTGTIADRIPIDSLKKLDLSRFKDFQVNIKTITKDTVSVNLGYKISEDGARLAQQLVTTVGTLVVAISSFYFGSTAVSNAKAKATEAANAGKQTNQPAQQTLPTDDKGGAVDKGPNQKGKNDVEEEGNG